MSESNQSLHWRSYNARREESKRVHHEMERFYQKYPKLRCQANHKAFLDAAQQDGGTEIVTAEWLELQLDLSRALTEAIEKRSCSDWEIQLPYDPHLDVDPFEVKETPS